MYTVLKYDYKMGKLVEFRVSVNKKGGYPKNRIFRITSFFT